MSDVGKDAASKMRHPGDTMSFEGVAMGASVLGCGHASQLFKVDFLDGTPQVHLHYLTDDSEYKRQGFGRLELVCHGCGCSQLVYYDDSKPRRSHIAVRNTFQRHHKKCQNRGYEEYCSNYRRTMDVIDMREPRAVRRRNAA
jgi:hypothetical protein